MRVGSLPRNGLPAARALAVWAAIIVAMAAAVPAPSFAQDGAASGLPGGASQLSEAHGDWVVACRAAPPSGEKQPARKACSLSQRQANAQGQTVLLVELWPAGAAGPKGGAEGVMVLPFGLAVRETASLKLDGNALGKPMPFSTCVPTGCVVPLTLDAAALTALKSGKIGTILAPRINAAPLEMTLPLGGFAGAFSRVLDLVK